MTFKEKEEAYTKLLEREAEKLGMNFIVDSGEGHDLELDEIYLEDVSVWLFPKGTPVEHQKDDEFYRFAEWRLEDDEILIEFKDYSWSQK